MKFNDYITTTNFRKRNYTYLDNQFQHFENRPPMEQRKTVWIVSKLSDSDGLKRAYRQGDYYIHGDTMYIAGSHTARDWYDDFTKVPVWGDLKNSLKYERAQKALIENPQVKTVVGHSLGGSVALQLEKDYKHITNSRTYGAPVLIC